jgi:hydrogenase-4 component F
MEATTLLSAPSIYFNQNPRSLEATWKYLLIGSVGIALALFGSFFLAYASLKSGLESTLLFDQLIQVAPKLSPQWLHAAFVLLFIGYGTKMGLAPMHTWKPDAYGEAPGIVGTLLAGGVTSCAFLAILRVYQICRAGAEAEFARAIMIFIGLLSMAVAAVFMARQRDFKRMLAYSSVEHMGILVLGIGIGGLAVYGALLHLINNGLTKGVLFLSAGNIHRAYGSKVTDDVRGAIRRLPLSGALFLAGFLAITGSPPFGPFVSEFTIVNAAVASGQFLAGGLFLLLLGIVFIGMGATVLAVVQGDAPDQKEATGFHDNIGTGAPILLFMALVLLLGLYIPPPLESLLREAAALVEVKQ